ncbi:flagellar hook capping FlgD N-terminal domain-containing protein [Sulfitobacter aestuarii]|uniref:Basal-body rod modification protein FlgD n=1 Tax=Sulfitobacter aestuarii TaxID=2161676 RepID=A0ABW5U614_9RHOB
MIISSIENQTSNIAAPSPQARAVLSSDFETFLQMLTTQAKYQDPLEPLDSSEYAAQLAQFSMVEQQVLSNDLLTTLSTQLGSGAAALNPGWIGMEVRTSAAVLFDGAPITIETRPAVGADQMTLVVYDAAGAEVQRRALSHDSGSVDWAGVTEGGVPFPNGIYRFEIESQAKGELLDSYAAESYAKIIETRIQDGLPLLVLEGGSTVPASDVSGLRAAT